MSGFDMFTDQQRRQLAHIYAALRECVADEVEYDREPEFPPLDAETQRAVWEMIDHQLTQLMVEAHAEEAARMQAASEAYWAAHRAQVDAVMEGPRADYGWQRLSDAPEDDEHPFTTWVREHVVQQDPDVQVWQRRRR